MRARSTPTDGSRVMRGLEFHTRGAERATMNNQRVIPFWVCVLSFSLCAGALIPACDREKSAEDAAGSTNAVTNDAGAKASDSVVANEADDAAAPKSERVRSKSEMSRGHGSPDSLAAS